MKRGYCEDRPTKNASEYVSCAGCGLPVEKGRNQIGENSYCGEKCYDKFCAKIQSVLVLHETSDGQRPSA